MLGASEAIPAPGLTWSILPPTDTCARPDISSYLGQAKAQLPRGTVWVALRVRCTNLLTPGQHPQLLLQSDGGIVGPEHLGGQPLHQVPASACSGRQSGCREEKGVTDGFRGDVRWAILSHWERASAAGSEQRTQWGQRQARHEPPLFFCLFVF